MDQATHNKIAFFPTRPEREIALLREYRTRLVTDVVTGQLDVRPATHHLPAVPADVPPAPDDADPEANDLTENVVVET